MLELYDTRKKCIDYATKTMDMDVTDQYERFLKYIPKGGHIIDMCCGPGRDVKYFADNGYVTLGFDNSHHMLSIASDYCCELLNVMVDYGTFEDLSDIPVDIDGIWCMAGLVHTPIPHLTRTIQTMVNGVKPGGVVYFSMKFDDPIHRGYTRVSHKEMHDILADIKYISVSDYDVEPDSIGRPWINVVIHKDM